MKHIYIHIKRERRIRRRRKRRGSRGKGRMKRKKKRIWPMSPWTCPGEICRAASTLETRKGWMLHVGPKARLQAEPLLLRSSVFLLRPSAAWMRPARTEEGDLLYSELLIQIVICSQNISQHHPKCV